MNRVTNVDHTYIPTSDVIDYVYLRERNADPRPANAGWDALKLPKICKVQSSSMLSSLDCMVNFGCLTQSASPREILR